MAFRAMTCAQRASGVLRQIVIAHFLATAQCAQGSDLTEDIRRMLESGEAMVELRAAKAGVGAHQSMYAADEVSFSKRGIRAIFYMVSKDGKLYLKRKTVAGYNQPEQAETLAMLGEGFLWSSTDDPREGWRIEDFNGDGNPDIMVVTARGASLGGVLRIMSIEPGKPVVDLLCASVLGWRFRVLQGQGAPTVEVFDRYRNSVQPYRWDGACIGPFERK